MIVSFRRARKEIGDFAGETAIAERDLGTLQRIFIGVGDALNRGVYLPLRNSDLEGEIGKSKSIRKFIEVISKLLMLSFGKRF